MSGLFSDHQGVGSGLDPGSQSRLLSLGTSDRSPDETTAAASVVSSNAYRSSGADVMSQRSSLQTNSHFALQPEERENSTLFLHF